MRFELAGTMAPVSPPYNPGLPSNIDPVVVVFTADDTFDAKHYADLGYTKFEVICIGAGGGAGGGYLSPYGGIGTYGLKHFGGAGGGGGAHLVTGNLLLLPDSTDVKVGVGGSAGTWKNDPSPTFDSGTGGQDNPGGAIDAYAVTGSTDGGDGGYSSFNTTTCRASGGKGGKKVQEVNWSPLKLTWCSRHNDGGDGGVGNSITPGGGKAGSTATENSDTTGAYVSGGVFGGHGSWDGTIGQGGGGGFGGGIKLSASSRSTPIFPAISGGSGSSTGSDVTIEEFSPQWTQDPTFNLDFNLVVPGGGGGAKTGKVNGDSINSFGEGGASGVGQNGIVVVFIYSE